MKTRKKKKKEIPLLKDVKIGFMHFDKNGEVNLLDNLENVKWIEYDKNTKM